MLLPEKVVSFDFPGCEGLKFDLAYLSKDSSQTLMKKCQKPKIDLKTRQPIEEFDDELFLQLYVRAILKGWTGLKLKYLKELALVAVPEEDEEKLLPFTEENALELMKNSTIIDNWVSGVITDLGKFTMSNSKEKSEE